MTPFIFKIILFVLVVGSLCINIAEVRKGEYMKKQSPLASAISGVVGTLLAIGIWVWL